MMLSKEHLVNADMEVYGTWSIDSEFIEVTAFGDTSRTFIPSYRAARLIEHTYPVDGPIVSVRDLHQGCDYCGNRSGLKDRRGCCVSCGAPING